MRLSEKKNNRKRQTCFIYEKLVRKKVMLKKNVRKQLKSTVKKKKVKL